MTSKYKICTNCGAEVDIDYNFCPNCKSQSFTQQPVAAQRVTPPSKLQKLLYWDYDGELVMSKTKVGSILVFIFLFISGLFTPFPAGVFIVALMFAAIAFCVGFLIHYIKGKPNPATINYNNYGIVPDLVHLLFFWQNKQTGEFVLSKTKIVSAIIFVVFTVLCLASLGFATLFAAVVFGLIIDVPAFLIGYAIHKTTNPNPTNPPKKIKPKKEPKKIFKKEEKPKPVVEEPPKVETIPKFDRYRDQINELKVEYKAKDEVARNLIEKRFEPPQLTYTRFITIVDKAKEVFDHESESALNILDLASEDSPRIDSEISSKIDILNSIIDKIEDLTNELVLSMDSSNKDDVNNLIDDMENLVSSVKDYSE